MTFNQPIDFGASGSGSFTVDDVEIAGPAGAVVATGISDLGDNQYSVLFLAQTARGTYRITVGPAILDLNGTAMDQDGDGTPGEPEQDAFSFAIAALDADTIFSTATYIPDGDTTYEGQDIAVVGATVTIDGPHSFNSVHLVDNAVLTHTAQATSGVSLTVSGDLIVDASSVISAPGKGYGSDSGPGAGGSRSYHCGAHFCVDSGGGGPEAQAVDRAMLQAERPTVRPPNRSRRAAAAERRVVR